MRISDWSSDVCSSDLLVAQRTGGRHPHLEVVRDTGTADNACGHPAPAVPARHEEQPSLAHAVGAVLDLLAQPDRGDADFSLRDSIPGLVAASVERGSIGGGLLCRPEKHLRIGRVGRLHTYPPGWNPFPSSSRVVDRKPADAPDDLDTFSHLTNL